MVKGAIPSPVPPARRPRLAKLLTIASAGASGSATWANSESKSYDASRAEQWRAQVGDKISENDEIRASLMESVAADIQGNTQDALISSETLGRDETLGASAQDIVSASNAYSESVSAGASMEASRNISAKVLIPAIAANPQAATELNDVIVQNGLAGEVQIYENFHGGRDIESFGGARSQPFSLKSNAGLWAVDISAPRSQAPVEALESHMR